MTSIGGKSVPHSGRNRPPRELTYSRVARAGPDSSKGKHFMISARPSLFPLAVLLLLLPGRAPADRQPNVFTRLFDGQSLKGWVAVGPEQPKPVVRDGSVVFPASGGGNLLTEKEYSDFILRFDFKLNKGGNNGVGIRTP